MLVKVRPRELTETRVVITHVVGGDTHGESWVVNVLTRAGLAKDQVAA